MDLKLTGRRALVVGGTTGIGFESARMFLEEGAEVAIAGHDAGRLAAAKGQLASGGSAPRAYLCDVTNQADVASLAAAVAAEFAPLNVLVHAVGGSFRKPFEGISDDEWLENYEFNVLGTVRTIRALLPSLRAAREPSIVMLGAASGKAPYPLQMASNVHKAGLMALTKTLGNELAPEGIRVNCVCPGRALSPLWERRLAQMARDEGVDEADIVARFSKEIPLGRFSSAEEVATMVAFVSSPRASYVTSQSISVDGGLARGLL